MRSSLTRKSFISFTFIAIAALVILNIRLKIHKQRLQTPELSLSQAISSEESIIGDVVIANAKFAPKPKHEKYFALKILCRINGDSRNGKAVQCLKDEENEVYIPFNSFLKHFYEIDGFIVENNQGSEIFEYWTTNVRMTTPEFETYDPAGPFGSFAHYNVENRDRVKLISGKYGVPMSIQWQKTPYFYPIQVAQYALEHYSKNLTEEKSVAKLDHVVRLAKKFYDSNINKTVFLFRTDRQSGESLRFNFSNRDVQAWPIVQFFVSFDHSIRKFVPSFTVTLKEMDSDKTFQIYYAADETLIKIQRPNRIFYGIGSECCHKYKRITRNIATDLMKGFALLYGLKKKNASKISLRNFQLISLSISGNGRLFDVNQLTSSHDAHFFDAIDFLIEMQQIQNDGSLRVPVPRTLASGLLNLTKNWPSAMAQGHFMSAVCRAFAITGNERFRTAASRATKIFDLDAKDGGVRNWFLNQTVWYEEYPTFPKVSKAVFTVSSRSVHKKHFYRGIYITEGMHAHKGDIIVRQGRLNYHPGLNVSMKTEYFDKVLRASCDGKVIITTEDVTPDFDLSEVENEYGWKKDVPLKKLTINVIPDELPGKFRLRETV